MRKHLTAALIFVVLTLILTNPLALHAWNSIEDKQDGLLNTWIVAWVGHALLTDPLNLFNSNIFYPYPNTLAFSEILVPQSLLALPLSLAAHNPIFGYNLALLAMLWLDGFAMYLFVFDTTRRREAAWIAGAIYAFNPFNLGNLAQLQLLTLGFLPLAMLYLRKMLDGETKGERNGKQGGPVAKFALLFALFFILQSLSSFYYAFLSGFAVGLYLVWWLFARRSELLNSVRSVIVPLAASFGLIAVVLAPFLLPYMSVQRELGFERHVQESEPFSASLKQFTQVAPENVIYGKFLSPDPVVRVGGYPLDTLFPGIVAIVLAVSGLIGLRIPFKTFLALLLLSSLVLALGPRLYLAPRQGTEIVLPYRWLYEFFSPLRALRAPVRFDALINFGLAGLAGLGATFWLERINGTRQKNLWVGLGIVALIGLEFLNVPAAHIAKLPVANEIPELYKWLGQQNQGVVLELPMMGPDANNELDISTQYFSTYHWQKTPDGYSGFVPPRRGEIAYEMQSFPSPRAISLLRALDVNFLVQHVGGADCMIFSGPIGYIKPISVPKMGDACIYSIPTSPKQQPEFEARIYVPSAVAAGAPFTAYLILANRLDFPYAVKPTDRATVQVFWNDKGDERVSFPIPLVTSTVSVVPLPLSAPNRGGQYGLTVRSSDAVIGQTNATTTVQVGNELAHEVVLPATVQLSGPSQNESARGETVAVHLAWLPFNKINAYYSASVRLVNEIGEKVANVDRQPVVETLLWNPDGRIEDVFALGIPSDIPAGQYRLEVLMYQGDTSESALLLDEDLQPRESIPLGVILVK